MSPVPEKTKKHITNLINFVLISLSISLSSSDQAFAQNPFPYGSRATVSSALTGCRELDRMNRVAELILQNDIQAAVTLSLRAESQCRSFEAGTRVVVEGFSAPHALACIRLEGDPDCYWFPSNYLRR